jgi:5-hydroxyisourate hydrolase-like protein (transthyretin family)
MTRPAWMPPPHHTTRPFVTIAVLASLAASITILLAAPAARAEASPVLEPGLPAGAANGAPASNSAVLTPVSPGSISRSYNDSAFRVSSRLLDANGQPIAGARIDVLQRVAETSQTQLVARAITGADGSFSVLVPSGPSRMIDIAYRAFAGDPVYAAQTEVFESVAAGVQLRITPRRTTPTGAVVFAGRVLGPIPSHGVVAEVLVYYQGQWQPIRTPRTSSTGCFRLVYQFHQAYGQFPFKAGVREGQVGFPYRGGYSRAVEVTAHR